MPTSDSGFEVVVIGAGVIGLAIAADFASHGRSVLILERASKIASGITSRNSEVVHAGLYYPTGSLKAELCVEGRDLLYAWCSERRVETRRLGKLIVANGPAEESVLEDLLARGLANGVVGLELFDANRVARIEPGISATGALFSEETGIVDGHGFSLSLLAAAEAEGAILSLDHSVESLSQQSFGWRLEIAHTSHTSHTIGSTEWIDAGIVVDAAGLDADRVAELAGLDVEGLGWRQSLCKGDYFSLAPGKGLSLNHLIYPLPEQAGLGIHATLDLAGRMRFGPDVEYIEEIDFDVDGAKADLFAQSIKRYLPDMKATDLVPDYAGIRPKLAGPGDGFRDFVVEETTSIGAPGFIACIGIESPGLTAAMAIARKVTGLGGA